MRYLMICILCIELSYALEKENPVNTLKEIKDHKFAKVKRHGSQLDSTILGSGTPVEAINIRSYIPSHVVIPSVSAASSLGSNQGFYVSSNVESYSRVSSLSDSSLGNSYPAAGFGTNFQSLGVEPQVISVPVQKISSVSDFGHILNLDSSFGAGLNSFQVKPIENANTVIASIPGVQQIKAISIEEGQLGFNNLKNFEVGTSNIDTISGLNSAILKEGTKSKSKPLDVVLVSIQRVPEVASFYSSGPLIPIDSSSVFKQKDTEHAEARLENSDDSILNLIEERISLSDSEKENNSASPSLENKNTFTLSSSLEADKIETTYQENSKINNNGLSISVESSVNNQETQRHETKVDHLENSAVDIGSRISENITAENSISINNNSLTDDNNLTDNILNQNTTTPTTPSLPVRILDANSFANANDILKENTKLEAELTGTLVQETSTTNNGLVASSKNETNLETVQNDKQTDNLDNTDSVVSRMSDDLGDGEVSQSVDSSTINATLDNANISQESVSNQSLLVSSLPVRKLDASSFANVSDILQETAEFNKIIELPELADSKLDENRTSNVNNTSESHTSVTTTESVLIEIRSGVDSVNLSEDIPSEIKIKSETDNKTSLEHPKRTCKCKKNKNKEKAIELETSNNSTNNVEPNVTNVESRFSETIDLENIVEPLSLKSVSQVNTSSDTLESERTQTSENTSESQTTETSPLLELLTVKHTESSTEKEIEASTVEEPIKIIDDDLKKSTESETLSPLQTSTIEP